jgi:hypothetical protein
MKKQRQIPGMMKRRRFTLVEMTVAMSIFAILMLIMMQLFGSIQTIWRTSNHKATASEDARFVTRLIKDMLETPVSDGTAQCVFYYQKNANSSKRENPSKPSLWIATTKPFNGITAPYEAAFFLEKKEVAGKKDWSNPLYDLYLAFTPASDANYDITTNANAYGSIIAIDTSSPSTNLLLLENVADFYVTPVPETAIASGVGSKTAPTRYRVVLKLLENPENADRYVKNGDADNTYTRTFSLVVENKTTP